MNIGLISVDGKSSFPNFALLRIAGYYRALGHNVSWVDPIFSQHYDKVFASKIFTFTPDYEYYHLLDTDELYKGGTGYDVHAMLPPEIEASTAMDYSLYPQCNASLQFFSRGCIRHCKFCLVRDKEGLIHPVEPVDLNPHGTYIEVLDNNFFANPEWRSAIDYLIKAKQPVNLHGVDIRIMNEEQAFYLNKLKLKNNIHIALDIPTLDLRDKLREVTKYISPRKLTCYVLVGFDSTREQDLFRLNSLKELRIMPFVMPYRDYENKRSPSQYEHDLCRWANRREYFKTFSFPDFQPRVGFKCSTYLNNKAI